MSEAEDPRAWIQGDETAKAVLARLLRERPFLLLPPLHRLPLRVGNVVEITGPSPSAKSQVLLQAAVHCILPKEWKGIRFGGLERIVIYFDLDCRFDVHRLNQILKHRIREVLGYTHNCNQGPQEGFREHDDHVTSTHSSDDELLLACMRRFLYVRCYNSLEFVAALKTMHSRIQTESEVLGVGIHFLVIDSIGAFYWIDRSYQSSNSGDSDRKLVPFQNRTETIVQEIRKFLEVQPVLVLVSKPSLFGSGTSTFDVQRSLETSSEVSKQSRASEREAQFLRREYMPSAWQAFVTHRILLQLSDRYAYDQERGTSPIYTSEWMQPPLNIKDQFAIGNVALQITRAIIPTFALISACVFGPRSTHGQASGRPFQAELDGIHIYFTPL